LHSEPPKPEGRFTLALGALGVLSIALAIWGWLHVSETGPIRHPVGSEHVAWPDAVYRGLKTFEMGEAYDEATEKFHGQDGLPFLQLARFLGAVVALLTLAGIGLKLFGDTWLPLWAGLRSRYVVVVVVIGDTPFADNLCKASKRRITHLRAPDERCTTHGKTIRLPLPEHSLRALRNVAAHRASQIFVAMGSDEKALELALALATRPEYKAAQISVRLTDPWLAKRVHQLPGAHTVQAFSEPDLAAREIVRRHPPYLLARDYNQSRIHALLIGDTDWLEAIMDEIILSACTLTYGRPVFTLVCDHAAAFAKRLRQRYPEIDLAAELHFRSTALKKGVASAGDVFDGVPITAVYIAMKDRAGVLSTAMTFMEAARKAANFGAPIFVLSCEGLELPQPPAGSALSAYTLVPFGILKDLTQAAGVMTHEADIAEKDYHAAYRQFAPEDGEANKPWGDLKEEYRVSNRRAVAHIYAKLFEAGFDLRSWMTRNDVWAKVPELATKEPLWRDEAEYRRLAELEHERWIADRRLSGWSYGAVRDNDRKFHPDMKPFKDLTPKVQGYDMKFIYLLAKILKSSDDGMARYSR
jgi:hypothetical protein